MNNLVVLREWYDLCVKIAANVCVLILTKIQMPAKIRLWKTIGVPEECLVPNLL